MGFQSADQSISARSSGFPLISPGRCLMRPRRDATGASPAESGTLSGSPGGYDIIMSTTQVSNVGRGESKRANSRLRTRPESAGRRCSRGFLPPCSQLRRWLLRRQRRVREYMSSWASEEPLPPPALRIWMKRTLFSTRRRARGTAGLK